MSKGPKVLIADDDKRVREVFARQLALRGCRIVEASNGEEAIQIHAQEQPDISLLDLRMPRADGFEVLRSIRERDPDAEVIIVTGHGDMDTAIRALRAGATDFIPKPVESQLLETTLERAEKRLQLKQRLLTTETHLMASQERFRAMFDHTAMGIYLTDMEGKFLAINPALEQILGYSSRELEGTSCAKIIHSDDVAADREMYQDLLAGDLEHYHVQRRYIHSSGHTVWGHLTVSLTRPIGEEPSYVISMLQDISERIEVEKHARNLLERQIAANNLALALGEAADLEQVYQIINTYVNDLMEAQAFIISFFDKHSETINAGFISSHQEVIDPTIFPPIPLEEPGYGTQSQVIRTGQPLYLPDFRKAMQSTVTEHTFTEEGQIHAGSPAEDVQHTQSALLVPMKIGGVTMGVMQVQSYQLDAYTEEDLYLLSSLANVAAVSIENARLLQTEREQRALTEALEQAAAIVGSTLNLDQVLDRILEQVARVVPGDAFNIMLIEENMLHVVRQRGYDSLLENEMATTGDRISKYSHLLQMLQTRRSLLVSDTGADSDWTHEDGWEWIKSYMGAPIQMAGLVVGFLNVDGTQPGQFTPDDLRWLETFAHHAAIAVENARLYRGAARRLSYTQTLREAMVTAASTLDFDQVLATTLEKLRAEMQVDFIAVVLPDQDEKHLTLHPSQVGLQGQARQALLPMNDSVCGKVFQSGEPMIIGDVSLIPHYYEASPGVKSELAVPVLVGGQTIGVLNVESTIVNAFDKEDLDFYSTIAGQLGIALKNAQLYREMRQQAHELEAAVERLEDLDRLKSEFIQNVSHELRTPLALIRGYAELLHSGELGPLPPHHQEPMHIITRRSQMLGTLVDDIILLLEAETRTPEMTPQAVGEIIAAETEDFRSMTKQAGLTLDVKVAPDLPLVNGEAIYLRRVLDNLLNNAIKFTPEGGQISVKAWAEGDQVLFSVSDTGIGIPLDQHERVFDRFYQVDGSTSRRYGGVGLGLSLVRELVHIHGGEIRLDSQDGQGTTFTISLPAIDPTNSAAN